MAARVFAIDTSVAVAAFASWHEKHEAAKRVVDAGVRLVAHCAAETYAVLTRLPPPHRAPSSVVRDYVEASFPKPFVTISSRAYRRFVRELSDKQVQGGATYDALVAASVAFARTDLVSCDRRALDIYERYGVKVHVL